MRWDRAQWEARRLLTPRISIGMSPTTSPTTPYGFNQGRAGDRKALLEKICRSASCSGSPASSGRWWLPSDAPRIPRLCQLVPPSVRLSHLRGRVAQYKLTGSGLWPVRVFLAGLGPASMPSDTMQPHLPRQMVFFPPCECMGSWDSKWWGGGQVMVA